MINAPASHQGRRAILSKVMSVFSGKWRPARGGVTGGHALDFDESPCRSVAVRAEDFAAVAGADRSPGLDVYRAFHEPDRPIGERDVDAAGMAAIGGRRDP